jgi:tryptophanyl-tRNA synthetase
VAEGVAEYLRPVRERYAELRPDEEAIEAALQRGAEQARTLAATTMVDVRRAMGVGPPGGELP